MKAKLLNFLVQNFKEKRLLFMAPGDGEPDGGMSLPDGTKHDPEATPEATEAPAPSPSDQRAQLSDDPAQSLIPGPVAEAQARVTAEKGNVETAKASITLDILRTKIKEQLGAGDEQLKEVLAFILVPDDVQTEIDADFAAVTGLLTEAEGMNNPDLIDHKIEEAQAQLGAINPEKYLEGRNVDQFKPLLAFMEKVKATSSNEVESHARTVKEEIGAAIIADLKNQEFDIVQKLKDEFSEKLAIALVADAIGETPEDFKAATRFYKLGQYKILNENHPKYKKSQEILQKFVAAKNEGKLQGIAFDFFGSTNNVDHRRTTSESWHKEKAKALEKVLAMNAAGNLQVSQDIAQFITDNQALIEQYNAAVTAGNKTDYMKLVDQNTDKFLKGGTIFDLALRLQRAADFKRFVENKPEPAEGEAHTDIFTDTDKVELRHQADDSEDALASGIKVKLAEEQAPQAAAEPPTEPAEEPKDQPDAVQRPDVPPEALAETAKLQRIIDREKALAIEKGFGYVTFEQAKATLGQTDSKYVKAGGTDTEPDIQPAQEYQYASETDDYTQKVIAKLKEEFQLDDAKWHEVRSKIGDPNYAVVQRTAAPTPTPSPTTDTPGDAMPTPNPLEALRTRNRETGEVLQRELEGASTDINQLIDKLETTIGTNSGFVQGAVAEKITEKRTLMAEVFRQVREKLKKALDYTAAKGFQDAKTFYEEADKLISDTLTKETEEDSAEAFLSDESKAVITEIRTKVEEKKPLVARAFVDKLNSLDALRAGEQ